MSHRREPVPIVQIQPIFLQRADAARYLAISESLLDSLVARGEAPKPRKLSKGRTAWLVADLDSWGRNRPESDLLPPTGCGHGRAGKPSLNS